MDMNWIDKILIGLLIALGVPVVLFIAAMFGNAELTLELINYAKANW